MAAIFEADRLDADARAARVEAVPRMTWPILAD
jgi:hypothetical protein